MFARLMFVNRHLPIQPDRAQMFSHYARVALGYTFSSQIRLHHFEPKCQCSLEERKNKSETWLKSDCDESIDNAQLFVKAFSEGF